MIGWLSGRIGYRAEDHVLIQAGGVGYVVFCSDRTLAGLPGDGEAAALFVETVVREDAITLYGFLTLAEKEWHRLLTSVQGIGAKGALAILGTLGADGTGRAISLGDAGAIRKAPGVGPKTAAARGDGTARQGARRAVAGRAGGRARRRGRGAGRCGG